jgi:hypothetical protein
MGTSSRSPPPTLFRSYPSARTFAAQPKPSSPRRPLAASQGPLQRSQGGQAQQSGERAKATSSAATSSTGPPRQERAELATGGTAGEAESAAFKRYIIELTNRSITDPDARQQVWQLLKELSKVIDVPNADHQLISLNVTLITAAGAQGAVEQKAQEAGARVRVEDDDF